MPNQLNHSPARWRLKAARMDRLKVLQPTPRCTEAPALENDCRPAGARGRIPWVTPESTERALVLVRVVTVFLSIHRS